MDYYRTDDSGHDAMSIEQDWQSEKERVMRDFTGRDLLDALAENDAVLLAITKAAVTDADLAVGVLVCTAVRKYVEDLADKSVFGRVTKRSW
jgi:hypothetical protein